MTKKGGDRILSPFIFEGWNRMGIKSILAIAIAVLTVINEQVEE